MGKPKIKVYFDCVSPFSYMGFWALENLAPFQGTAIDKVYTPIFLGGLMKACDNRPPIEITNKGAWINTERQTWARLFNIPMRRDTPPGFPLLTLPCMRVLTALSLGSHHCCVNKAGLALFHAHWVDHLNIADPKVIFDVLAKPEVLGEANTREVMEQMGEKRVKDKLSENTKECFEAGGFGLPWFEVTNEGGETKGFWGFDHLGQVAEFLGLDRPKSGGWRAVL